MVSHEQLNQSVIAGLVNLGLISEEFADSSAKLNFVPQIGGGFSAILSFDSTETSPPVKNKPGRPAGQGTRQAAPRTAPVVNDEHEALVLNVKAALKANMEHPTTITTIRKWTTEQLHTALKWATGPKNVRRPSFIVERKARTTTMPPPARSSVRPSSAPAGDTEPSHGIRISALSNMDEHATS